jgi:hypothetical protein
MKITSTIAQLRARLRRSPRRPTPVTLRVQVVDDPEGALRIVGVRGTIDETTIADLVRVLRECGPWQGLHLDLVDSRITSGPVLRQLEAAVDQVEFGGVAVRIVGLDPSRLALIR